MFSKCFKKKMQIVSFLRCLDLESYLTSFILFFAVRMLKRTKSNTIVLSGLSGSGKTVLFYQVIPHIPLRFQSLIIDF
jgi:Cdc6-like AAA superfamily ATPase